MRRDKRLSRAIVGVSRPREECEMWITLLAIVVATAICFSIAAIVMQPAHKP
jgi:hypothetical protein